MNLPGAAASTDCLPCTGGYYCAGSGLTSPTGMCTAGYYCPDNETISSATPSGFECPVNYKCPTGSAKPEPCLSGEYQANMGMSVCSKCPAGYYCNTTGNVPIKYDCPAYHYCPEGDKYNSSIISVFPCVCVHNFLKKDSQQKGSSYRCKVFGSKFCLKECSCSMKEMKIQRMT